MILAFGAFLAGDAGEIILPTGNADRIRVAAKPMSFDAPVSLALEEDRVTRETQEGDTDDFDGVERDNDPAFFEPDEWEAEAEDSNTGESDDS